ncbi:Dual specificity phosphatase, catalytic domain [Desulfocicer vacuolatum DSM 3385]|uniref:Dual specificity phosphatase, catalytic domain n=1 Tax=Desulfocicer vacuolatum DSM 3385 TaxID=1121400 RepID=A0A1W2DBC6_9BACT|nr:dual specificity protein phosphatase family protein [Desulfocicer vacuolatum]SMC94765.1 Dual specificity phosphatase, catalytic domain [Desulfocicer vacuolatum DSM 3385]
MSQYQLTWITDSLAVGYAPTSYAELDDIKAQKINAIVNLCAEFSDLHEIEEAAGFEVYYLPIWDEDIPEMKDMEKALAWLDEAIYLEKKVLVHCRHGIGRTGTFITSYMIRRGLGLKAAKKKLKSSRANPSNYCQWKMLRQYGKKSGTLKIREASLEMKKRVDLSRFFADYEDLLKEMTGKVKAQNREYETNQSSCGESVDSCCRKFFEISFMEAVYLYSTTNRIFTSTQRESLIQRAVTASKEKDRLCPLNNGNGCEIYDIRPARCQFYEMGVPALHDKINGMLTELSRTLFLALSGQFMPPKDVTFSVAETISGKFVQKYFHIMMENGNI